MKIAEGIEWAAHACAVLAALPAGQGLNAAALASFHELPPAYMAKHLQALSNAGIVTAIRGAHGGYALARPASEITLWDIQAAISGSRPSFQCQDIRRKGPCAPYSPIGIPCVIACAFVAAEQTYKAAKFPCLWSRCVRAEHDSRAHVGARRRLRCHALGSQLGEIGLACRAVARGNRPAFALRATAQQPSRRFASEGWYGADLRRTALQSGLNKRSGQSAFSHMPGQGNRRDASSAMRSPIRRNHGAVPCNFRPGPSIRPSKVSSMVLMVFRASRSSQSLPSRSKSMRHKVKGLRPI